MIEVILKRDATICFDDLRDNNGFRTMILKSGDLTPINMIDDNLANEFEIFKPYVNQYYIDIDRLFGSNQIYVDDIDQLILTHDDWKFDEKKIEKDFNELLEEYGINKMTAEEKQARINEWDAIAASIPKPKETIEEMRISLLQFAFNSAR